MKNYGKQALSHEAEKAEVIETIRQAIDMRYRRICEAARSDWERLIGPDPADACVTVRVQSSSASRGSGFLKSRRPKSHANGSVPHFAH